MSSYPTLHLVQERKIADLFFTGLPGVDSEASGVLAKDGKYFVVFDNHAAVARLSVDLTANEMNGLFGRGPNCDGYEGITYNPDKNRYYLLVESRKRKGGQYKAEIIEYDDTLSFVKSRTVEFAFESDNKGFEAVGHVQRDGQDYLLALCEGNKCKSGRRGRKPGGGRIQLFAKKKRRWSHVGTIKLPQSAFFQDYSGMAIDNHCVAIVSQVDSALWMGVFEEATWQWRDGGRTYQFPRTTDGDIQYGNVEGVAWITDRRLVTVSDRRKGDQPEHFAIKDQSIHVFDLPE